MSNVDKTSKQWISEQSPKVQRVYTNEFMKFLTDASPLRTARKIFQENKREERRLRQGGIQHDNSLANTIRSHHNSANETSIFEAEGSL